MQKVFKKLFLVSAFALGTYMAVSSSASAQDSTALPPGDAGGTCCPETGSDCIVGTVVRENKFYYIGGSCND